MPSDLRDRNETIKSKLRELAEYQKIVQWKKSLYSRHYEMYTVGTKNDPSVGLEELEKSIEIILLRPEFRENSTVLELQESTDSGSSVHKTPHKAYRVIIGLFHVFLQVALFLVQLSVVPLLIFQIFDTYTLLCVAERDYCDTESQYRLHLDQTAISFAFYCALMISLLVTKWLILATFPWKRKITDSRAAQQIELNTSQETDDHSCALQQAELSTSQETDSRATQQVTVELNTLHETDSRTPQQDELSTSQETDSHAAQQATVELNTSLETTV